MNKEQRKEKFEKIKPYIELGITGLGELFTGAVCNSVMDQVEGKKIFRYGAKAGGALVGLMIGDKVSECVFKRMENFIDDMEEIKESVDMETEEA